MTRTRLVLATLVVSTLVAAPLAAQTPAGLLASTLGKGLMDWGKTMAEEAYKQQNPIRDVLKDFDPMSPDDRSNDASYDNGPTQLPSACEDQSSSCEQCGYGSAVGDLQSVRYNLEKLRRVYAETKTIVSHSLAVGDSMAGSAGVGGLQWVHEREKILASFKTVQTAYDNKYQQQMARLKQALEKIAACEERVYGEKDWYQRYGFMYYEFMAGRYERAD